MNKVILIGNLTAAPETRKMQDGTVRCSFRLAVQRDFKNSQTGERDADFITIITWRQLAEVCGKYLGKGRKVGVLGSLRTRTYDDTDGVKHYVTEVVADNVEFLSPKDSQKQDDGYQTPDLPDDYGYITADDSQCPFDM